MQALIVESTRTFQRVLGLKFRRAGFAVTIAASGADAIERLDGGRFDIVCVSYQLTDMNGIMLCESLREHVGRRVPVIMVTSVEDQAFQVASMKSGITEVFSKFDMARLDRYLAMTAERSRIDAELNGTVLYIEDNRTAAMPVMRALKKMGLRVEHFNHARPALQAFAERDYDLVLTDVILEGGMSGLELVREVRQSPGDRGRVPILALSGVDDVARKVELLRGGVNDLIGKPVVREELTARVGNLIQNKRLMDRVAEQQTRLEHLAMTDPLTGLLNRHYMREAFTGRASDARRHRSPLSLVVVDLDDFKRINDGHGHTVGDAVLVEVAEVLQGNCRKEDFVVRYGGEEFVVVMPRCAGRDAMARAEGMRRSIEALRPTGLPVTASIGVAELPLDRIVSMRELFDVADRALFSAKQAGRNRVRLGAVELPAEGHG